MAGLGAYRASRRIPCRRWWTRGRRRRRGPPCRCWRPGSPSFSWSTPGTCPPWARAWPGSRARSFLAVFGSRKWLIEALGRCWFFWSEYSTRGGPPPTRRYRHASSFRAPSWAQSIDRGRGRSRLKAFYHTRSRDPLALLAFRVAPVTLEFFAQAATHASCRKDSRYCTSSLLPV